MTSADEILESLVRHAMTAGMDAAHSFGATDCDHAEFLVEEVMDLFKHARDRARAEEVLSSLIDIQSEIEHLWTEAADDPGVPFDPEAHPYADGRWKTGTPIAITDAHESLCDSISDLSEYASGGGGARHE